MSRHTGKTTAAVKLRSGAGSNDPVLAVLTPQTPFTVLKRQGDWYYVNVAGRQGYVHSRFVSLEDPGVFADSPLEKPIPPRRLSADAPLEVPEAEKLRVNPKAPLLERLVADTWNRFGGLLQALAHELGIDPGVAVALLAVEAGGRGFGPDGRMIIRFENQVFFDQWGRKNERRFNQHFTFNQNQHWLDHKWRPTPDEAWRPADLPDFHGDQDREWEVFSFARTLDDTAAKLSISMGTPQIMGFNYLAIGYEAVHEMFDAFSASERSQIVGFFDFVQGPSANSRRMLALQQQDFNAFAAQYNGPGQASKYGSLIRTAFDGLQKMRRI